MTVTVRPVAQPSRVSGVCLAFVSTSLLALASCSVDAPNYTGPDASQGPDAADEPDAGTPAFDVAFPNQWRFSVQGPVGGYLLVINRRAIPLSMESLFVQSIQDDHPTANVRVMSNTGATTIPPGAAGGSLSLASEMVLVDSGIVTEPRADVDSDYLSLEVLNAPSGTYDIHVMLTLGLDNLDVPMLMTIHVVPGPTVYADPEAGTRTTIYR